MRRRIVAKLLFVLLVSVSSRALTNSLRAQDSSAAPTLKIGGAVATPLVLTPEDLKKMPRKTLSVMNPHENKTEVYEGVLVQDVLNPFRLVAPHEKRPARWVRMLKSITVVRAS